MKDFLKICATLALILISLAMEAAELPTISLQQKDSKSFTLLLEELNQQAYTIQLKDRAGVRLFQEKLVGKAAFGKVYNLKNLPAGVYTLTVENKQTLFSQVITIEGASLKINTENWKTSYKPHFNHGYDHLDLIFLQLENWSTKVEILNIDNEVIFTKTIKETGSICLRFDTQKLDYGDYTFKVSVGGKTYLEPFSTKNLMSYQCP